MISAPPVVKLAEIREELNFDGQASAACAAESLAIGTLNGEHDT